MCAAWTSRSCDWHKKVCSHVYQIAWIFICVGQCFFFFATDNWTDNWPDSAEKIKYMMSLRGLTFTLAIKNPDICACEIEDEITSMCNRRLNYSRQKHGPTIVDNLQCSLFSACTGQLDNAALKNISHCHLSCENAKFWFGPFVDWVADLNGKLFRKSQWRCSHW